MILFICVDFLFLCKEEFIGHFSKNIDILDLNKTILENIIDTTVYSETIVRTILARSLFKGDDINKKVEILS